MALSFRLSVIFLLPVLQVLQLQAQSQIPVFHNSESVQWTDSVIATMTYEEKIGQLFMVDAYSNRDTSHTSFITSLIRDYHIGGIIFFQGGPVRQALLSNLFQSQSRIPLMIGIDGEWGLSMRLDSTIRYPRQMTLSAIGNDSLVYRMARETGRQCSRMGIQMNFAPVADINNNPLNPVISSRSFGERPDQVANYALMYMRGLQDEHVLACGKHFPGHGNTDSDSHLTLPTIRQTAGEMDSVELYPFRKLIAGGIAGMMVAHLSIPAFDTTFNLASTLSPTLVRDLLTEKMRFGGLIFTDAMNMKGVADYFTQGEAELRALQAGNDVILYSPDVPSAWKRIHFAIQNCEITQEEIDGKVKKILEAKYWSGLNMRTQVDTTGLIADLNTAGAEYLSRILYEKAITVVTNRNGVIPFGDLGTSSMASLVINDTLRNPFQLMMGNYAHPDLYRADRDPSPSQADSLFNALSGYDYVIASIHNTSTKATAGYGISDVVKQLLTRLEEKTKLILVVFGNAYTLSRLGDPQLPAAIVMAYEDTGWPQHYAAQLLFGATSATGKLPVTPGNGIAFGTGLPLQLPLTRLRFGHPLEQGIDPSMFQKVDSLAHAAINSGATPGCQVMAVLNGEVIYMKSFGKFTYDSTATVVADTSLYDLASVTKMAGTALAIMKLQEKGDINIGRKASKYFKELRKTNKKDLLIRDIMTHSAGLEAWIPFWKETMDNGKPSYNIYHHERDVNYSVQVADSLFILNDYRDHIWQEIFDSKVTPPGKYVYSDIGMLIMQRIVEEVTGKPLDTYLREEFYEPLGLHRLMFNPKGKVADAGIVPTENDTDFRKSLVWGFVHDPAAAMLGGVAGHAGLFGDAESVAVIMQMLLNGGAYGGKRYLKPETVALFTTRFNMTGKNRRGLVFDKPDAALGKNGPTAVSATPFTFGHTGFTGTAAWADPGNKLVFIFLANRVYPTAANNKLSQGNYRTDIMEAFYEVYRKIKKPAR